MRLAGRGTTIAAAAVLLALAIALTAVAAAGAGRPVRIRTGNLDLTFRGAVEPNRLSRTKLTPISFDFAGKIKAVDGTHPPALTEFVLETDPAGVLDVRGLPACPDGRLQSTTTARAEAACRGALVGRGETTVQIAFPERQPIPVRSPLLVVNGGRHGGVTTLYLHAYITVPTAVAIVVPVRIATAVAIVVPVRIARISGRYGLRSVAKIPAIAGGSGSVTRFDLEIEREFTHRGQRRSIVSARCDDGVLEARGEARFADGTIVEGNIFQGCTPLD